MGPGAPVLPQQAARLRLLCPAKINLYLRVGPRRDDGLHPLLTWMCTVGLFDRLTLQTLPGPPAAATALTTMPATARAQRTGSGRDTAPHVQTLVPGGAGAGDATPAGGT